MQFLTPCTRHRVHERVLEGGKLFQKCLEKNKYNYSFLGFRNGEGLPLPGASRTGWRSRGQVKGGFGPVVQQSVTAG
jgi:hypothetical protein